MTAVRPKERAVKLHIDKATRRKLRQSLGSRTSRRYGANARGREKPRQALAKLIEQLKREQTAARLTGESNV